MSGIGKPQGLCGGRAATLGVEGGERVRQLGRPRTPVEPEDNPARPGATRPASATSHPTSGRAGHARHRSARTRRRHARCAKLRTIQKILPIWNANLQACDTRRRWVMAARRPGAAMAAVALAAALTMVASACSSSQPEPPAPVKKADAAVSTVPVTPTSTPRPQPPNLFSLSPASGRGHLAPGSDPLALPGDVLIADENNNRLLLVDPQGRIRWQFPRRGDLAGGQGFLLPDDAFVSPDGRAIIVTQETGRHRLGGRHRHGPDHPALRAPRRARIGARLLQPSRRRDDAPGWRLPRPGHHQLQDLRTWAGPVPGDSQASARREPASTTRRLGSGARTAPSR